MASRQDTKPFLMDTFFLARSGRHGRQTRARRRGQHGHGQHGRRGPGQQEPRPDTQYGRHSPQVTITRSELFFLEYYLYKPPSPSLTDTFTKILDPCTFTTNAVSINISRHFIVLYI